MFKTFIPIKMNYFVNERTFEQYYNNNCQKLISLKMNPQEIISYVTNSATTIQKRVNTWNGNYLIGLIKMVLPRQKLHTRTNLEILKAMEVLIYSQRD